MEKTKKHIGKMLIASVILFGIVVSSYFHINYGNAEKSITVIAGINPQNANASNQYCTNFEPEFYGTVEINAHVGDSVNLKSGMYRILARDFEDGNITKDIKIKSSSVEVDSNYNVNTGNAGKYKVTYTVTDSNGNTITKDVPINITASGKNTIKRKVYNLSEEENKRIANLRATRFSKRVNQNQQNLGIYLPADSATNIYCYGDINNEIRIVYQSDHSFKESKGAHSQGNEEISFMYDNSNPVLAHCNSLEEFGNLEKRVNNTDTIFTNEDVGKSQKLQNRVSVEYYDENDDTWKSLQDYDNKSYSCVPTIMTPSNSTNVILEIEINDSIKSLDYYTYNDVWNPNMENDFAIIDANETQFLIPKIDYKKIGSKEKEDYFKNINEMIEYFDEIISTYDNWVGLSYNTDNISHKNVRTKIFAKPDRVCAGAAVSDSGNAMCWHSFSLESCLIKYDWGPLHEISHAYDSIACDKSYLHFEDIGTNFMPYFFRVKHGRVGWQGSLDVYDKAIMDGVDECEFPYLSSDTEFKHKASLVNLTNENGIERDAWPIRLFAYVNLFNKAGYENTLRQYYMSIREEYSVWKKMRYNNLEFMVSKISESSKYNVIPYFERWKANDITRDVRDGVFDKGYKIPYLIRDLVDSDDKAIAIKNQLRQEGMYSLATPDEIENCNNVLNLNLGKGTVNINFSDEVRNDLKGKSLVIKNGSNEIKRITITDKTNYNLTDLPIGAYQITVDNTNYLLNTQYVVVKENKTENINLEKIIDEDKPEVKFTKEGDKIKIRCFDKSSGINTIKYMLTDHNAEPLLDSNNWIHINNNELIDNKGKFVWVYVEDKAGNTCLAGNDTSEYDGDKMIIAYHHDFKLDTWNNQDIVINVYKEEMPGSIGVIKLYSETFSQEELDEMIVRGNTSEVYTITVKKEGKNDLTIVRDNGEEDGEVDGKTVHVWLDKTKPTEPQINLPGALINGKYLQGTNVKIVDGTDSLSGVKETTVKVTKNGVSVNVQNPKNFNLTEVGTYKITATTTDNAGNSSTKSQTIEIVDPKGIAGIKINPLTKTNYIQNYDTLDTDNESISVITNDGLLAPSVKLSDTEVTGFDNSKVGKCTLTVKYQDCTDTTTVNIVSKSLESISIKNQPDKTLYKVGENFDPKGMVVEAHYNDETSESPIEGYTITNGNNLKEGQKEVIIGYIKDGIAADPVSVKISVKDQVKKVTLISSPTKKQYIEGTEQLDATGGILQVEYLSGKKENINLNELDDSPEVKLKGFNGNKVGKQTITVQYEGYEGENPTFEITVVAKKLDRIDITSEPSKTEYLVGQNFDSKGMIVTATYDNGTTSPITSYEIVDGTNLTEGKEDVTIRYTENNITKTTTQKITVKDQIKEITLTSLPTKKQYVEGTEQLDATGGILQVVYLSGKKENIDLGKIGASSKVKINGFNGSKVGKQTITVQYEGYEGENPTFEITVVAKKLDRIDITTPPNKVDYVVGQNFAPEGMIVTATYDNGTIIPITNYEVVDGNNLAKGKTDVTIRYTDTDNNITRTKTQDITVEEKVIKTIRIAKEPNTTKYIEGQNFDTAGMEVKLVYNDGSEVVTEDFELQNETNLKLNQRVVSVGYRIGSKRVFVSQRITVEERVLTDLNVTNSPTNTVYLEEQEFNTEGMIVKATYNGKLVEEIPYGRENGGYEVTNGQKLTAGQENVTISYKYKDVTKTATQDITVNAKKLDYIEITTPSNKTKYVEGQNFDAEGMIVKAYYNNESSKTPIENYTITNGNNLRKGQDSVTVSYTEDNITKTTTQKIEVIENKVEAIELVSWPTKTQYIQGEKQLDVSGAKLRVTYTIGESSEIQLSSQGVTIRGFDSSTLGNKSITVEYGGKTTGFEIQVVAKKLDSIEITTPPNKTKYIEEENFDKAGMIVKATYDNGDTLGIDNYTIIDGNNLTLTRKDVTISYTEGNITKTTTQNITMVKKAFSGITIQIPPAKTTYTEGENFDTRGMKVMAVFNNGNQEEVTNYTVRNGNNLQLGTKKVTISYTMDGVTKTVTQTITVKEKVKEIYAKIMKDQNGKSDIKIVAGATIKMDITNKRDFGGFRAIKTDSQTGKRIEGIELKLYKKDSGWVSFDKNDENKAISVTENSVNYATPLTTDKNGITETIIRLPLGDYEVYETSVGNNKQYKLGESEVNGEKFTGDYKGTVTVKANKISQTIAYPVTESRITNEPVPEISLSGVVWEEEGQGKTWDYFDSKLGNNDYKLDGIEIKLVNGATGEVRTTKTQEINGVHGSYRFEEVNTEDLDNLYIAFIYDGITYQSVNRGSMSDASASKAEESSTQRNNLNKAFSELTGEGQEIQYAGNKVNLSYDSNVDQNNLNAEPTVTLKNICDRDSAINTSNRNSGFMQITKQGDFLVNSYITNSYLKELYNLTANKSSGTIAEISNLNLGLYKRIQPDLKLTAEISKATVTVDGISWIYNNKSKGNPELNTWPNGVSFERKFPGENDPKYKLPIRQADLIGENPANPEDELKVYATYKIALTNNSGTGLSTRVNSIVEKYSKEFRFNRAYMIDANGQERAIEVDKSAEDTINGAYNSIAITGLNNAVGTIDANNTKYIYVVLEIPKSEISVNGQLADENKIYRNWAEISSYTVLKDGNPYAQVDGDSIPNNGMFPARNEDDEDWATGLQLIHGIERHGDGFIFEDTIVGERGAGKEVLGNGVYDSTEKGIGNVKVELINKNNNSVVQSTITKADGSYELNSFRSGTYYIRFTWGEGMGTQTSYGKQITVDDYKSTIWKNGASQNSDSRWFNQDGERLSDALDDWETRKLLDKDNTSLQELLNNTPTSQGSAVMTAITRDIVVPFEIEEVELELEDGTTVTEEREKSIVDFIKNVDFGLIERPKQSIEIEKGVESVKVLSDQDQPIIEAYIKDGKLDILSGKNYVTGGPQLGYIKCEVDTDIINSGTHAEVGYKITVKNTSEVDYDNSAYYHYGRRSGNLVTLTTDGIYDYLSGISTDVDKVKDEWEILNKSSTSDRETVTTILAHNLSKTGYKQETDAGTKYITEVVGSRMRETIEEYYQNEILTIKKAQSVFKGGNEISKLASEITLEPGKSKDISYSASTIVTTTGDIRFDNATELTNVKRNSIVGRNVNVESSNFYDKSEYITITPPTGENRDYTTITIVAISAIAVLGVGIILIKKVVLK